MSGSFELGEKFGHFIDSGALVLYPAEREAFYHAARAEMANEIIAELEAPYKMGQGSFIERLRAMADREGK